ncbi:MAG TPA: ClpXP protease specificity-enhancing factor SspB [Pseudolabrys sp.]|nr:ClpXP protease specificity-enhancing factor SspB [Pseudolabrys sp.]
MADHIRYDLLTQQALRGVVRAVLADAAKKGLPGDHHFYISFETQAEGVRLSDRLRAQYPEDMTIILQHQFWDLAVTDAGFEVGMSFGGIPEKLYIPFAAVTGFFDPSVQFGLQFEEVADEQAPGAEGATAAKSAPKAVPKTDAAAPKPAQPSVPVTPAVTPLAPAAAGEPEEPKPDKPPGGGEVVRLDRFRKK